METLVMTAGSDLIPRERIFGGSVRRAGSGPRRPERPPGEAEGKPKSEEDESDDGL